MLRHWFAYDLFTRPDCAERFTRRPAVVLRALVGLSEEQEQWLFQSYFTASTVRSPASSIRLAAAQLGAGVSPELLSPSLANTNGPGS
jgi:hypothetical protein